MGLRCVAAVPTSPLMTHFPTVIRKCSIIVGECSNTNAIPHYYTTLLHYYYASPLLLHTPPPTTTTALPHYYYTSPPLLLHFPTTTTLPYYYYYTFPISLRFPTTTTTTTLPHYYISLAHPIYKFQCVSSFISSAHAPQTVSSTQLYPLSTSPLLPPPSNPRLPVCSKFLAFSQVSNVPWGDLEIWS